MDNDLNDPFASTVRPWHPALDAHHKLPSDVDYRLVDGFLQDERYAKWSSGYRPWQLHCWGGPGCGKTTFAAIAFNNLKRRYQLQDRVRVASVYIRDGVYNDHPSFMEDLLTCVYSQLSGCADSRKSYSAQLPRGYKEACRDGAASTERIDLARTALHDLLLANEHSFLVLDGYDRLDAAARMLLDHELKDSHLRNLSLLITRRSPSYRKPQHMNTECDNCHTQNLNLFWQCQKCPKDEAPTFCYNCHEKAAACQKDGHSMTLAEPYSRIDIDIRRAYALEVSYDVRIRSPLEHYVARELARESGQSEDQISEKLITDITDRSDGNINLAKLRLDDFHVEEAQKEADRVADRLPRGVVAFFDAEIERIKGQSPANRDLALMSIAAVAKDGNEGSCMRVDLLEQWTREERSKSPHLARNPVRSLEDILSAANGLLTLLPYEEKLHVACFDATFARYVFEDYNKSLSSAAEGLNSRAEESEPEDRAGYYMPNLIESPRLSQEPFYPVGHDESVVDEAYYSGPNSRQTSTNVVKTIGQFDNAGATESRICDQSQNTQVFDEAISMAIVVEDVQTEAVQNQSLCSFCEEHVMGSEVSQGLHHDSLETLQKIVTGRCAFCSDLYRNILSGSVSTADTETIKWPCYSWTVRSNGRTRNSKESITISFKPVPHADQPSQPTFKSKRYHILSSPDVGEILTPEALTDSTDPNTPGGGGALKNWLKTCNETHADCYKYFPGAFVPTRLVDIDTGSAEIVRVVHTGVEGIQTKYGTLSHSWGPTKFLSLTKDNEARLTGLQGIHIDELSQNFMEAVSVARFIGLKYIWIDSLCIMQGSGGDFDSEGQLMHKVYRYSFCNIAIADSADSKGGVFRSREAADVIPAKYESDGRGKLDIGEWRVLSEDVWKEELLGTKIYTRGWVFQERMLSPRILHFAAHQIFWDCSTLSACESLPSGLPHALDSISSTDRHWRARIQVSAPSSPSSSSEHIKKAIVGEIDDSIELFWKNALLSYTSCNLTSQGDKTVAIWSIAKMVRDVLQDSQDDDDEEEEYGGGLWMAALEEQLAWHMRDCVADMRVPELTMRNPSWSWASVKGPVIAHDRIVPDRCYRVENHEGGNVEFEIEDYGTNKDNEPRLKRKELEMCGYVGQGRLRAGSAKNGVLGMDVLAIEEDGEEDDGSGSSGTFEVFLDEALPKDEMPETPFEFIVLAATSESPDDDENTNEEDDENLTYSGTGLLLISHPAYASQQRDKFKHLLKEVVSRTPDKLIPDPEWGQGLSLVAQTAEMRELVKMLLDREKMDLHGVGIERCYRRLGAVEFWDVGANTWRRMNGEGMVKILLD